MSTLQVCTAAVVAFEWRILGLGLILGDALTKMRDGGDCRCTTFGA